jgi:hypothetical protein
MVEPAMTGRADQARNATAAAARKPRATSTLPYRTAPAPMPVGLATMSATAR